MDESVGSLVGGSGQSSLGVRSKWKSWVILLSFLVVWMLVLIISSLAIFLVLFVVGISEGMALSISGILAYIILIPLTIFFIHVDGNLERTKQMLSFGSTKRVLILFIGVPLVITIIDFVLSMIYTIIWLGIIGEPSTNTDLGTNWESNYIDIAMLFISVAIVTPIVEELMFRGYILDAINRKHSDWTAIIWSSILFGLIHIDPFVMGQAFMGGILYGWIRIRTGSLLPSIAGHMMWNMLALALTYL
ncbi:MAG: type II CAAX endopeptidase family protein [Candidatus Thermoplasmatota archaeon]|nr:type II CAAX endopeptidase family protein [Candidatus Thermoplasmatota archaeon]